MKTLIYGLYVAAVLVFSAFARAEVAMPYSKILPKQAPVAITDVAVAPETMDLQIDGYLPNPCYPQPLITLVQDVENPNVLRLRLSSPVPTHACPSRIQKYSMTVNLPVLAQNSRLVLANKNAYVVKFEGFEYEMQVLGSDLNKVPGFMAF
jgi:hypothetical protein